MVTMRVCILANALAVHTQRWARALTERGHEVTVMSIRSADIEGAEVLTEKVGPVNSANPVWTFLSYLRLLLRVRSLVRRISPEVVNAHFCITHGVIAALAGLRPRVVNLWGSDVIWSGTSAMPRWRRSLLRISVERADAVVSTSHFMLAEAQRVVTKLPRSRVVPFGVDVERFHPATTDPSATDGRPVVVGFVKTFKDVYAPDLFLEAASLATDRCPELRFVMAGRGPLRAWCEETAARLGISDRVTFPGFVEHHRVPELMRSLDILVNCSRSESFGVVICEASASSLPVIATDVGGVRETMTDGKTGVLVPRDDPDALAHAICQLASDPGLRIRMGEEGRKMVTRRFNWHDNVTAFETILFESSRKDDPRPH